MRNPTDEDSTRRRQSCVVVLAGRLGDHGFVDDWGRPAKTMPVKDARLFAPTGDTYRIDHGYVTHDHWIFESLDDWSDVRRVRLVKVIDAIGGMGHHWRELDEAGTGLALLDFGVEWVDAKDGLPFTIDGAPTPADQIRMAYGNPRMP